MSHNRRQSKHLLEGVFYASPKYFLVLFHAFRETILTVDRYAIFIDRLALKRCGYSVCIGSCLCLYKFACGVSGVFFRRLKCRGWSFCRLACAVTGRFRKCIFLRPSDFLFAAGRVCLLAPGAFGALSTCFSYEAYSVRFRMSKSVCIKGLFLYLTR